MEPFVAQEIPEPEVAEKKATAVTSGKSHALVLWNDDHNTFDHVINCLVKYIKKTVAEAEEIAHIVHNKGKCVIMEGNKTDLVEYYNILKLEGLTVTIE
ncbi:MAG TPA: ATP-dependent Clp protease adaptor ClpS [Anseongella sp.]|nr:ATP-dependent Clp protease adaptor ClpS [Anseongella sp.]